MGSFKTFELLRKAFRVRDLATVLAFFAVGAVAGHTDLASATSCLEPLGEQRAYRLTSATNPDTGESLPPHLLWPIDVTFEADSVPSASFWLRTPDDPTFLRYEYDGEPR